MSPKATGFVMGMAVGMLAYHIYLNKTPRTSQ